MSKVYIFNPSSSLVQYTVNGGRTPFVPAASSNFTPNFIAVQRYEYVSTGAFGYGTNQFVTYFHDANSGETHDHHFTFEIMRICSLLDDLIIYGYRTKLLLMNTSGFAVSPQGLFIDESPAEERGKVRPGADDREIREGIPRYRFTPTGSG
jgi:hypothetical protein